MYAVIRTGGKQYRVEPGVELLVEKLEGTQTGKSVVLDDVLIFSDGQNVEVGQPKLPASVHCTCLGDERGPKLRSIKYKRRKHYRRTFGHRQDYARLRIERLEKK